MRVRRVSSHAISSTSRNTRSARSVTSSRLPMGVATTNNVPVIALWVSTGRPPVPPAQSWGEAASGAVRPAKRRKGGKAPLRASSRLLLGLGDEHGALAVEDHLARDHAFLQPLD